MADWAETEVPVVLTPSLKALADRAFVYLRAGLPVHFQGPAGAGKTTLARYLAERRGRPIHLLYGNEAFAGWDLAGQAAGYRQQSVVDNYIRSVVKRTTQVEKLWSYGRLLRAVREGGTLIYDEFTRSRPEANNLLLAVLEEGVLEVPESRRGGLQQVPVHPEFRVLFTSNSSEYAGVHGEMDALRDRMVTLQVGLRDFDTDVAIVAGRTGASAEVAAVVVAAIEQRLKPGARSRSLRPALMAAQVIVHAGVPAEPGHPAFEQVCDDMAGIQEGVRA